MSKYKYEQRDAQGKVCCAGDKPDFARCDRCRGAQQPKTPVFATAAAWRSHLARVLGVHPDMDDAAERAEGGTHRGPEPTDDPAYSPFGQPPDGYKLALKGRRVTSADLMPSALGEPPDGYKLALKARKETTV